MQNGGKTTKRIIGGVLITVALIVVLVIAFISPLSKYLIEHYSETYTGRKIKMSWIYVNPFTGFIHMKNLRIYEYQSDTVFFSANGLSVSFSLFKMISKTYQVNSVTLDKPYGRVIQDHDYFNFNDLIKKFSPKGPPDTSSKRPPTKFNLVDVKINDGEFYYEERSIPVKYFIKKVNISSPGMWWNVDTVTLNYYLQNGPGKGEIKGQSTINLKNLDYRDSTQVKNFELQIIQQYLHDITTYGSFKASVDASIHATGNLGEKLGINANGFLSINDFHFGKQPGDDYISFDRVVMDMKEVNPTGHTYIIDSAMINHPFFKYERYDSLDNAQRMFGKNGSQYTSVKEDETKFNLIVEIAKYIKEIAKNFLHSYYKVNKLAIYRGNVVFNDFAPSEKFSIAADPLYFVADSIDRHFKWMKLSLTSGVQPYGGLNIGLRIDPNDYGNFNVVYDLQKIPATIFNPYLITYTSFPLDRGTIEFKGNWLVKDSMINSDNRVIILDPRHAKRLRKRDAKWLPLPLILSVVRGPSNVIDMDIPIRGTLKDPHFMLHDAIWGVIRNLFVKPPLTPYLIHTSLVQHKVEKYLTLKWETRQIDLRPKQEKFIKRIAGFLKKNPGATLTVSPYIYKEKEKEYILVYEAKKKYFLQARNVKQLSMEDSMVVEKMSIKDPGFTAYLNRVVKDTMLFTVQEKCSRIISDALVSARLRQLEKRQEAVFFSYFDSTAARQIKMTALQYEVPYNGFSYYKFVYPGEIPPELIKAYLQMEELNNEDPRGKYRKERRKNNTTLREDI